MSGSKGSVRSVAVLSGAGISAESGVPTEINPQPTPLSDAADRVIRPPSAQALPHWWDVWSAELQTRKGGRRSSERDL